MNCLRLGYLATLVLVVALVRPALADDEMGSMDGGGGDPGGMDGGGGDWGGMDNGGGDWGGGNGGGYYVPGYQQSYPSDGEGYYTSPSYPSYPSYPANNGGYAPANNGSSYAPQHAAPPANRLPHHSAGSATSTAGPPTNRLPRHRRSNLPTPTEVGHVVTCRPPENSLPPEVCTLSEPTVCTKAPHHNPPKNQFGGPLLTLEPTVCTLGPDPNPPQAQSDNLASAVISHVATDGLDGNQRGAVVGVTLTNPTATAPQTTMEPATIHADVVDVQRQQVPVIRSLLDLIPNQQAVDVLINQLPNPPYNEAARSDIRRAVNDGNLTELQRLDRGVNSPAFTQLVQITRAVNAVNRVERRAREGTLTRTDIQNALAALEPFTTDPRVRSITQRLLNGLLESSNTVARLDRDRRRLPPVVSSQSMPRPRPTNPSVPVVSVSRPPVIIPTPATGPSMASFPPAGSAPAPAPAPARTPAPAPASPPTAGPAFAGGAAAAPAPAAGSGVGPAAMPAAGPAMAGGPAMSPASAAGSAAVPARTAAPAVAPTFSGMQASARRISEPAAAIMLVNADERYTIGYTANGRQLELKPGYQQSLPGDSRWTIEFDRGNDFGTARYAVVSGRYQFVVTEHGWDLVQIVSPTGDATATQPSSDEVSLQRQ